jgi:hypothetical protein
LGGCGSVTASTTSMSPTGVPGAGTVRPLVTAYGRTTGPASRSSHLSFGAIMPGHPVAGSDPENLGGADRCLPIRRTSMAIS